jgi:hypothetical protein
MNQEEQAKKMSQLIAKCWADEGFKRKLLANPAATLKAEGVELPAGPSYKALENTDKVHHLVIPAKPTDLSDADLDMAVGGNLPAGIKGSTGGGTQVAVHFCITGTCGTSDLCAL